MPISDPTLNPPPNMPDNTPAPHSNHQSTSRTRRSFSHSSTPSSSSSSSSSSPTPHNPSAPATPSPKTPSSPQDSTCHPLDEALHQPPTPPLPEMQPAKKRRLLRVSPLTTDLVNHKWTRNDDRLLLNFWERNIENFCSMSKVAFGRFAAADLNKWFGKRGDVLATHIQVTNKLAYWERRVAELGRKDELIGWDHELYTRGAGLMKIVEEKEREKEKKNEIEGEGGEARESDGAADVPMVREEHGQEGKEDKREQEEGVREDQCGPPSVLAGEFSVDSIDDGTGCMHVEHSSAGEQGWKSQLKQHATSVDKGVDVEQEQVVSQGCVDNDVMKTAHHEDGAAEQGREGMGLLTRPASFRKSIGGEREEHREEICGGEADIKAVAIQTAPAEVGEASVERPYLLRRYVSSGREKCDELRPSVKLGRVQGGHGNLAAQRVSDGGVGTRTGVMRGLEFWGDAERSDERGRFEMKKVVVEELINLAREFSRVRKGSDAYHCLMVAKSVLIASANKLSDGAV